MGTMDEHCKEYEPGGGGASPVSRAMRGCVRARWSELGVWRRVVGVMELRGAVAVQSGRRGGG